jgi:hypothetical protein
LYSLLFRGLVIIPRQGQQGHSFCRLVAHFLPKGFCQHSIRGQLSTQYNEKSRTIDVWDQFKEIGIASVSHSVWSLQKLVTCNFSWKCVVSWVHCLCLLSQISYRSKRQCTLYSRREWTPLSLWELFLFRTYCGRAILRILIFPPALLDIGRCESIFYTDSARSNSTGSGL